MQNIADIFPSSDTLDKITDVESQLRRRRSIGGLGWAFLILGSTVQIAAEINDLGILSIDKLWKNDPWLAAALVMVTLLIILSLLLITWSTYWLKASKRPFRYTCSIGEFMPIDGKKAGHRNIDKAMDWLSQDLSRILNERVQRFDFLESGSSSDGNSHDGDADSGYDTHIHIHGNYLVRTSDACEECIEVSARVRIGPPGSPEVLAPAPPPIKINLDGDENATRRTYDELLERVYHSVVSAVYRQLQDDVQRKIELLPTLKLRVIALLHEADDYAQSNTLHAYDQAAELYNRAAKWLEITLRPLPESPLHRFLFEIRGGISEARRALRRFESRFRPKVAEIDVLLARALTGYTLMQNIRLNIKSLVGDRFRFSRFEPICYIEMAHRFLLDLSDDVHGREQALFHCLTVQAFAYFTVGDRKQAIGALNAARSMNPRRADDDQIYLYASARIATEMRTRISILRQAVGLDPRFELAQFELAYETEMLWRSREIFEHHGAEMVIAEYKKVTDINPGNLAGWANSGHVSWLIGNLSEAKSNFELGIRFREVQKNAYVSELQFGMARILVEQGAIAEAYNFYFAAVSSIISGGDYGEYFYAHMTPQTLDRYKKYYKNFIDRLRTIPERIRPTTTEAKEVRRLTNSIHAFVLYDLGRALYGASLSDKFLSNKCYGLRHSAMRKFHLASCRNPEFALPHYWIGILTDDFEESRERLEIAIELEPLWSDAMLAQVKRFAEAAHKAEEEVENNKQRRKELKDMEAELEGLKQSRSVWDTSQSGSAEGARSASSKLMHQYDINVGRYAVHPRPGTRKQPLALDAEQTFAVSRDERDKIVALETQIGKTRSEIRRDETIRSKYSDSAGYYRDIAEEKIKQLLPHDWLWNRNQFNWDAVSDRLLRKYMVWERDLNIDNAQALYFWALRFVYDVEQQDKAELLLRLLRDRFWPAETNVLHQLLEVRLGMVKSDADKRDLILEAVERYPEVMKRWYSLKDYGFSLDEEIVLLNRLYKEAPSAETAIVSEKLADALYRRAEIALKGETEPWREASSYLKKALGLPQPALQVAKVHLKMAQVLMLSDDADSIARAIKHVATTDQLRGYPNSELPLRSLYAKLAELKLQEKSANVWGGLAENSMDLNPGICVRMTRQAHEALVAHRKKDGGTEKTLDDLHWGLYWELGVLFPRPVIKVDTEIDEEDRYHIDLFGIKLVSGYVSPDHMLINATTQTLKGLNITALEAVNPANGRDSAFVAMTTYEENKQTLDNFGYNWDAFGYIVLHIASVMRKQAAELLRIDNVGELLEFHELADKKAAYEENGELAALTNVLRAFLAEEFPISDLPLLVRIFEAERPQHAGLTELAEAIRNHQDFRRKNRYVSQSRRLFLPLGPKFTDAVSEGVARTEGQVLALKPLVVQKLLEAVREGVANISSDQPNPVILARSDLRIWVKRLLELEFPHLWVLSDREALPEHMHELGPEIELL